MKKYLLLSLALASLNCAYAEVIELDSGNAQNCIKQLSQAKDNLPIILEYMEHCPYYHKFLPIFAQSASDHAELSYYKINVESITNEVKDKCLGEGSAYAFVSPKVSVNSFHAGNPSSYILQFRSDVGSLKQPFSADDLNYLLRNIAKQNNLSAQHSLQVK